MLCAAELWHTQRNVCELLNAAALTQPLCSSALMRRRRACGPVPDCECCKRVSLWLTLLYSWNNSSTHQVAVAPRSQEQKCHLRNTACFFAEAYMQLSTSVLLGSLKGNKRMNDRRRVGKISESPCDAKLATLVPHQCMFSCKSFNNMLLLLKTKRLF